MARRRIARRFLGSALGAAALLACDGRPIAATPAAQPAATPVAPAAQPASAAVASPVEKLRVEVLDVHPHDPQAFTQGLLWLDGGLYESTGLYGQSSLRRVDPEHGTVLDGVAVAPDYFGEGLARVGNRLIQLTWQSGVALTYDLATLAPLETFGYSGEGWGLAFDGTRLLMTDGSARVTFRDPSDFRAVGGVDVTLDGQPLRDLNELEWVDGALWANVWQQDRIVRIDVATGQVTAVVDASHLLSAAESRGVDVLNGIAYDASTRSFWITGKLWPKTFRVRFVPVAAP